MVKSIPHLRPCEMPWQLNIVIELFEILKTWSRKHKSCSLTCVLSVLLEDAQQNAKWHLLLFVSLNWTTFCWPLLQLIYVVKYVVKYLPRKLLSAVLPSVLFSWCGVGGRGEHSSLLCHSPGEALVVVRIAPFCVILFCFPGHLACGHLVISLLHGQWQNVKGLPSLY